MMKIGVLWLAVPAVLCAQEIKFPANFARLADKADEVVDLTLDTSMLGFAARFLSEGSPDEAKAKRIIAGLKGIYIRSFEFSREGEYDEKDVDDIRQQLRSPEWSRILSVRKRKKTSDNAEIFLKKDGETISGLTLLAAEPMKLTVVHIVGSISVEDLSKIGGNLGIPKVELDPGKEKEN
jgi:hypothetical protein